MEYKREFEIYLTTYDGAQHLRLHGWLKRNQALIKAESIRGGKDHKTFGTFTAYVDDMLLEKLKEANYEKGLYCDIEVTNIPDGDTAGRWTGDNFTFFEPNLERNENFFKKIQDFMSNFEIKDKDKIEEFVAEANQKSIDLFRSDPSFIKEYIETKDMSKKDKLKDLNLMIEAFEEEERYEDCALLIKIMDKIKLYNLKQKIRGNE